MFIQIGDRIINKAQIVSVEYEREWFGWSKGPTPRLRIFTTTTEPTDFGPESKSFALYEDEATALWEQLQHYLAPTVI